MSKKKEGQSNLNYFMTNHLIKVLFALGIIGAVYMVGKYNNWW